MKTYSELIKLETFRERLDYLYIGDRIGHETFGVNRYFNQKFYMSPEWRDFKRGIVIRDYGCDLGIAGCELGKKTILVHHITPITLEDIINHRPCVLDPENVICVSHSTHNYIHFGTKIPEYVERTPNDMCPWKRG